MTIRNFLVACALLIGIHILLGLFTIWDNGYFIYGVFAPERFLFHLLRDDGSRFTVSGSVAYYLNDICVQSCERCEFLCYSKENLRIVCNDARCGLESNKKKRILDSGGKAYFIAKEGMLFENATFQCDRNRSRCSISTELGDGISYDTFMPEEIPFYGD